MQISYFKIQFKLQDSMGSPEFVPVSVCCNIVQIILALTIKNNGVYSFF